MLPGDFALPYAGLFQASSLDDNLEAPLLDIAASKEHIAALSVCRHRCKTDGVRSVQGSQIVMLRQLRATSSNMRRHVYLRARLPDDIEILLATVASTGSFSASLEARLNASSRAASVLLRTSS